MSSDTVSEIPLRTLGRTGERVSGIGLGGWHRGFEQFDEKMSIRTIREAIDRGINFLDNSWDYNDGESERRMGRALRNGYLRPLHPAASVPCTLSDSSTPTTAARAALRPSARSPDADR